MPLPHERIMTIKNKDSKRNIMIKKLSREIVSDVEEEFTPRFN